MRLLAGAAAALQAACAAEKPQQPKTDGVGPSSGAGDDGISDDGTSQPGSGYLVVDMLPPPSRCGGEIAPTLSTSATLRPSKLGNDVVITLRSTSGAKVPLGAGAPNEAGSSAARLEGGGTGDVTVKEVGGATEISFLYDGTSTQAYVNVMVVCATDAGAVMITVTIDPNRQTPGAALETNVAAAFGH